ncbi:MAG: hypothetical protein ABS916_08080 [Carnobacterium sp.]|uniref:hypothetical protein n=1 Tax=Carnobacterium sp. TaxID=48221 RepID=UPI003314ECDD
MKKRISMLLVVPILLLGIFLVNKSAQKKIPTLVNFSGTTYVLTHEPYKGSVQLIKVYVVQKKVNRYSYPEKNLESNF